MRPQQSAQLFIKLSNLTGQLPVGTAYLRPQWFFCSRDCCLCAMHQSVKELRHARRQREQETKQKPKAKPNQKTLFKTSMGPLLVQDPERFWKKGFLSHLKRWSKPPAASPSLQSSMLTPVAIPAQLIEVVEKIKENNCLNSVFAVVLCQVAHFSHSLCSWTVLLFRLRFRSGAQTRTGHQETVQATVLQLRQCCHRPCSPKICRGTTGPLHENDSTPSSAHAVRQECLCKKRGRSM